MSRTPDVNVQSYLEEAPMRAALTIVADGIRAWS
jgi:hypothetical protein